MPSITSRAVADANSIADALEVKVEETAEFDDEEVPTGTVRLNVNVEGRAYRAIQRVLKSHHIPLSRATRFGLGIFVTALPDLRDGGSLILRSAHGDEKVFVFPGNMAGA